jgi:hypothetical protein
MRFWFAEEPVLPIWLFRAGLCAWTAAFFLPRLPYLEELYGPWPVHTPAEPLALIGPVVLPLWAVTLLVGAVLVGLVLFAGGRWPRAVHLLLLPALGYLVAYDFTAVRGYGKLAVIQWGLLWFAAYQRPWHDEAPVWGKRIIMLQFSSVYVFTVFAKTIDGAGWLDGTTLYWSMLSPTYGQHLLSDWLPITPTLAMLMSWAVLSGELVVGFGLWFRRTRGLAMLACVGLHLGMALTLRVSLLFHALMLLHLLLFVPADRWRVLLSRRQPSRARGATPSPSGRPASI